MLLAGTSMFCKVTQETIIIIIIIIIIVICSFLGNSPASEF